MSRRTFKLDEWIERLIARLDEIVSYERDIENSVSDLRRRGEQMLGLPAGIDIDKNATIRDRIARYYLTSKPAKYLVLDYEQNVSRCQDAILTVLREHPTLDRSIYLSDDKLVFGIDLAIQREQGYDAKRMVIGLVDYAMEHDPNTAAHAFAQMIERGANHDFNSYSMMLFRGLHVTDIHHIRSGLSVISWDEARQYMSNTDVRPLLGRSNRIDSAPIGAIVAPVKWGPAIVPKDYDFEQGWPDRPSTFRDDALLLIDLLAVTHERPVQSTGRVTNCVEREIERLVGMGGYVRSVPGLSDDVSSVIVPDKPVLLIDKLAEASDLFAKMRGDGGRLRLALSWLASSLSRSGPRASLDRVVDSAIALELMYRAGSELSYRLATRASYFLESTSDQRMETYDIIRSFYSVRSKIMHGRASDDNASLSAIEQAYRGGFVVAQRTLRKVVLEGGPSNTSDWDRFVITGQS